MKLYVTACTCSPGCGLRGMVGARSRAVALTSFGIYLEHCGARVADDSDLAAAGLVGVQRAMAGEYVEFLVESLDDDPDDPEED